MSNHLQNQDPEENMDQNARFDRFAQQWQRETGLHSNPHFIVNNDAFREIVEMGGEALPFIFRKLERGEHGLWWMLLERITGTRLTDGVTPIEGVPGWVKTDAGALNEAWLSWGQERGHLEEDERR